QARRLRQADRAPARLLSAPQPPGGGAGRGDRRAGRGSRPDAASPGGDVMIVLKSPRELERMRAAGKILSEVKDRLKAMVRPGLSPQQIDVEVEAFILSRGARSAFKGYRGFPATVCTSINEEVVHGIPSPTRKLRDGDIIGLDLGCIVDGYYADCAITLAIGRIPSRVQELLDVTRESLDKAIVQGRVGN